MSDKGNKGLQVGAGATLGFGSVLAIAMSWSANHAIGWAVLHGFFGWGYVVYYVLAHDDWTWF